MLARVCALVGVLLAGVASAQTVTLGSPLTPGVDSNISIDCAVQPALIPDASGNYGLFTSGVPDCTWRQAGVFGAPNDSRFSSVPGDGRIIAVTVKSGPTPAPLRFVIMRQLSTPGFGAEGQCCFYVGESAPVQPAANTTQTFPVNIPVVRNTIDGIFAVDLFAISAASNTGTLPLAAVGPVNAFNLTSPGSVNAGFFYPRIGAIPNDAGGGRREEALPGVELLVNFTWCPAAAGGNAPGVCGAGGGGGGGGGGGAAGPALRSQNAAVARNRALLDLACNGDALCRGVLELLSVGAQTTVTAAELPAVARATGGAARYGKRKFKLQPGANATLGVALNGKAKKALKASGSLSALVRLTPKGGGTPVTGTVTLTR